MDANLHPYVVNVIKSLQKSNTLPCLQEVSLERTVIYSFCVISSRIWNIQAVRDTGGTSMIVLFLEHSLDQLAQSPLTADAKVIRKGSACTDNMLLSGFEKDPVVADL